MAKKVSNKQFYEELKPCIVAYRECEREDKTPFEFVTKELGEYFEQVINKVLSNKNWIRGVQEFDYDDIRQDARLQLWKHYHKFNPEKTNPFAYFTTMILNSALATLKQIKGKNYVNKITLYQDDSTETINISQL